MIFALPPDPYFKKGERPQGSGRKLCKKHECIHGTWKLFITDTKRRQLEDEHTQKHTQTAKVHFVVTTTQRNVARTQLIKVVHLSRSATKWPYSEIREDVSCFISDDFKGRNHFTVSQRSTKVPAAFLLTVGKHSGLFEQDRDQLMTCNV